MFKRVPEGIYLEKDILNQFRNDIYSNYNEQETNFLTFIFTILEKNEFGFISYIGLFNNFYHYLPEEIKLESEIKSSEKEEDHQKQKQELSSISDGTKKDSLRDENLVGFSGESVPHPIVIGEQEEGEVIVDDIRVIPINEVAERISEPIERFGIWISKIDLDHVITWNGKYDLTDERYLELFGKIEENLNVEYGKNTWAYPIQKNDGYLISVALQKKRHSAERYVGTIRVNIPRHFDPEIIFQEAYFRIFHFLDAEEHKLVLDELLDEETKDGLFYVELANAVAPEPIVRENFRKAKLECEMYNGAGGKTWVRVVIDYSLGKGKPEIEIKGQKVPSENLRDCIKNPVVYANSIVHMKNVLRKDNRIHLGMLQENGQVLVQVNEKMDAQKEQLESYSEKMEGYHDKVNVIDIKQDIIQVENRNNFLSLKQHFRKVLQGIKNHSDDLGESVKYLDRDIQELKPYIDDVSYENAKEILNGVESFIQTHKRENAQSFRNISEKIETLDFEIKKGFDTMKHFLEDIIKKEFSDFNTQLQNNLYLIVRKLHELPKITVNELLKEVDIPRSSLYNYLSKLRESNLVEMDKQNDGTPGRPKGVYFLGRKIKNKLQSKKN